MLIKNITDKKSPKPIGIGNIIIMPGESAEISDEIAYVDEKDKSGKKTGKKIILPSIVLLNGMDQITYEENKPQVKKAEEEPVEEVKEEAVVEKPKRGRKKATE